MNTKIRLYVVSVVLAAVALGGVLYGLRPTYDSSELSAAMSFAALGVLALVLSHRSNQGTSGSIASIPYLASVLVTTSWVSIVAVTLGAVLIELTRKSGSLKGSFNPAQYAFSLSLALLAYVGLGGRPLLVAHDLRLIPYAALVTTFFLSNTLLVSAAVAISENQSTFKVWRGMTGGSLLYDFLASPVPYVFAWVYAVQGPGWAAGLAFPLLAIRQIYKTNYQLEQTHHELLQLMVKAIEARDPYTSGHSQRVANYSRIIARAMGLKAREVERVGKAALLHDVGKIHEIYAPILLKPGKLTPEEWRIMQTHPIKSEELVRTVSSLKDLLGPIRHHHENWDGTGYPDGIAGEEIPLGARIITLADTIDAMTTDRPYRQALGKAEVEAEIVRLRGKQYDPVICDAIVRGSYLETLIEGSSGKRTPGYSPMLMTSSPARRIKGSVGA